MCQAAGCLEADRPGEAGLGLNRADTERYSLSPSYLETGHRHCQDVRRCSWSQEDQEGDKDHHEQEGRWRGDYGGDRDPGHQRDVRLWSW